MLKSVRHAKVTVLDGRSFIKASHPVLESPACRTAVEGLERIVRGEHRLLTICLSPTMNCPMNCAYCYAKNHPPAPELSTQRWVELIGEAQDLGVFSVHYSGGEPMLRDDLPELIAATDARSNSMVMTSGLHFPRMSRRLHDAGLEIVVVSLDTFDEDAYNRRRGHPNAFGIAREAVRVALADGFYTALGMLPDVSMLEVDAFDDFVRRAGRLGVHEIRVSVPRPSLPLGRHRAELFTSRQCRRLYQHQHRYNGMAALPTVTSMDFAEGPENQGCCGGTCYAHVTASGEVTPCTMSPISFGNVTHRPLAEIYENMRRHHPYPLSHCPLPEVWRLIRDVPDDELPVRDEKTVARIMRKIYGQNRRLPRLWKALGVRTGAPT